MIESNRPLSEAEDRALILRNRAEDRANYPDTEEGTVSEHTYVADLELASGPRWTSVHRTYAGAERRLIEKANAWIYVESDITRLDRLDDDDIRDRVHSYGISYLPIED